MLVLRVFVNIDRIGEVRFQRIGHAVPLRDDVHCYRVWRYKGKGKQRNVVFVEHNRKKGWEDLMIRGLKKLLLKEKVR